MVPVSGHTYQWSLSSGGNIVGSANNYSIDINWGAVAGTYTLTLTETNTTIPLQAGCNPKQFTKTIQVQPLLHSYFYYQASDACYNNNVDFFGNVSVHSDPSITYSWDFGDGGSSTLANPIHTFPPVPPGTTYTVTLTVQNSAGQQDQITDYVYVNPDMYKPVATFTTDQTPSCLYGEYVFNASQSRPYPPTTNEPGYIRYYKWDFGDPTSARNIVTQYFPTDTVHHRFETYGVHTVTLLVVNDKYCEKVFTMDVNVQNSVPVAHYSNNTPCLNEATIFTDQSITPVGNIVLWEYNFGDGFTFSTSNPAQSSPTHTYSELGTYHVTQKVTNDRGCNHTFESDVTINRSPMAEFTFDPVCIADPVTFNNASTPNGGRPITGYLWNFGDPSSGSNSSTDENPVHTYNSTGIYTVTLITTNEDGCSNTKTHTVTVHPRPDATYTWSYGTPTYTVDFVDQTDPNVVGNNLQWEFGDGTMGYGHDPSHTYPGAGIFSVTLIATDINNCSRSFTDQVDVPGTSIALFFHDSPKCVGQDMTFTALAPTTGYISQEFWNFGDGNTQTVLFPFTPSQVIHAYTTAGTYTVSHTVTYAPSGYTDTWSTDVVVFPNPIANFTWDNVVGGQAQYACNNQLVYFKDLSVPNGPGLIYQWHWDFGDPASGSNNLSDIQSPSHLFMGGAGTYIVTLTVTNNINNCSHTIAYPVDVHPGPPVEFAFNNNTCANQVVDFVADGTVMTFADIVSWDWDFGDGKPHSFNPQTASHLYDVAGHYTAILRVKDLHGCFSSISHEVTIIPQPNTLFTFSTPTCDGLPVQFTDHSFVPAGFPGYIEKWEWDWGDGSGIETILLPASPNVPHTFPTGVYSFLVKLTVTTNYGCTGTYQTTVNVIPAPTASFQWSTTLCAGQSVQFTDISQTNGGGNINQWSWNFGDPTSGSSNFSTSPNPNHVYLTAGPYSVTLLVTNVNNCTSTITLPITINAKPVADFTYTPACEGSSMQFTDASTANALSITSYFWSFGDGNTSTLKDPLNTYSNFGIYNVTLNIVNSNGCTHSVTKQVTVNPKAIPEFTFSSTSCVGAPVTFTDHSYMPTGFTGYIEHWTWNFDDGSAPVTIDYPNNPDITYTFIGTSTVHNVTLTTETTEGCISSITHTVNSVPSPVANFSYSTLNCATQPVQFTDHSQENGGGAILGWSWDFGDPTSGGSNLSTQQHPQHVFNIASPTPYTVTLVVTNANGCTNTYSTTITINARPFADFTATTPCQGSETSFTDISTSSGTIVGWNWIFGDGGVSTIQNPTHTYSTSGSFLVKLTVTTNQGCTKDTTKLVEVLGKPLSNFNFTSPTCASDSVHFTDLSSTPHGSIYTWKWEFGDGDIQTITFPASPNVVHKYDAGGTFLVKLTITTTDSCKAEKTNPVTIIPAPLANFDFPATRCALMSIQFNDLSQLNNGSAIVSWEWNFDDPASGISNTSTSQNPTHSFTTGGTTPFNVELIVTSADGCKDTISKPVSVNEAPFATYSADTSCFATPTQFMDESTTPTGTTITAWLWNFGDPASGTWNTSTEQNPSHTFTLANTTYTVKLTITNSNSCEKDTTQQIYVNPKPTAMFSNTTSCVGDSTYFTDLSIAPGSQVIGWFWDFGDGIGTSTLQNPSYAYATGGTFTAKLVVTNLEGCHDSIMIPVVTRPKPTAAFAYVNFFCPEGRVNFQDQSTGVNAAITEHYWIFEPGQISTEVNPQHTFSVPGMNYAVTLIITDNYGCKDTIVDSVYVKPGFSFTFENDTVCLGYPTHFQTVNNAEGDSLYSVVWNFGNPASGAQNTSYLYNPEHTFTTPGNYIVKLKAWNSDNCVDSVYREIQVFAPPQPAFTFLSEPCDSTIYFTDSTTNAGTGAIASWEWRFGDGSAPLIIPAPGPGNTSHLYVTPGFYQTMLIITNTNGCVDSLKKTVQRFPCIKANYSYPDSLLCANYTIIFSDSSLPIDRITQWKWTWGDGSDTTYTTHSSPITHTWLLAGTYPVTLTINAMISGTPIVDSIKQLITIHATPETYFANAPVCLNAITLFRDTSNTYGDPITRWSWTFGEPSSVPQDTSTARNPGHTYVTPGLFDTKLIVMNRWGCKDSLMKSTRVYGLPLAHFESSPACQGDPTYFYDKSITADTAVGFWRWNFGDTLIMKDTSNLQDPEYTYRITGNYDVRFMVKDYNGCIDTIDSTVRVNITPVSAFTVTDSYSGTQGKIKLNNQSTGANAYSWDFGNGKSSEEENPVANFTEDGTYIIKLISLNEFDCTDTTFFEYNLLFKGLYVPNAFAPSSTNLGVRFFKPVGINLKQYHVVVFDTWGHLMWESILLDTKGSPSEGWDGTFNGANMPQGNYMWKITATFVDDTPWNGSDIGMGEYKTMGTVTLIR